MRVTTDDGGHVLTGAKRIVGRPRTFTGSDAVAGAGIAVP